MRTRFETTQGLDAAQKSLNDGLSKFSPALHIRPTAQKPRALVLVTKESPVSYTHLTLPTILRV